MERLRHYHRRVRTAARARDGLVAVAALLAISAAVWLSNALLDVAMPTIGALVLLLIVLGTATLARLRVAIGISLAAMLAFNFFFLPPLHTFTIADPQNWVALVVFLAVAVTASHLSASARQRAKEGEERRLEVTRLFDLSRDILLTTESDRAIPDLARYVARRFELDAVAICLPGSAGWEISQGADRAVDPARSDLDHAFARLRGTLEYDARQRAYGGHVQLPGPERPITLVPLRLGTRPVGLLATDSPRLEVGTLDALGGVVAIAIERTHFLEERKQAEALSQRADLASALLASFSHDLRTPLTAVRIAVANLQEPTASEAERQAQAQLALTEIDRLDRLFQDILDMARIDAAAVKAARQWITPADIVDAAVAYIGPPLASRELRIDAEAETEVEVDPRLTSTALAHLLENAAQYSPGGCPIDIRAWVNGEGVHVTVRDRGPGLDPAEIERVFEPFYRGPRVRHAKGTGLGLPITRGLLAAEGGRVWGENVPDGGTRFTMIVPGRVRSLARQAT